jgi:cytochrome c-type biogenesis protein CcmH
VRKQFLSAPMGWMLAFIMACMPAMAGAQASQPAVKQATPMAEDPVLEARVMSVAEELRCLVCQNETIAASNADLAQDLRKQIRIKLREGQSEQQILDFMTERYGDFVLYRPPLKASTVLLWLGPFVLLITAGAVLAVNIRRRRPSAAATELSPAEARRARQLLGDTAEPDTTQRPPTST